MGNVVMEVANSLKLVRLNRLVLGALLSALILKLIINKILKVHTIQKVNTFSKTSI